MPTTTQILEYLRDAANDAIPLAIFWHLAVVYAALMLLLGWRPTERSIGQLLALPLASVGVVGLVAGNPFNGLVFLGLAGVLAWLARRQAAAREPIHFAPLSSVALGGASLATGLLYSHFFEGATVWTYLYAAPVGVIPCPTLYAVIGLALIARLENRAWMRTLAVAGLFYGITGVVQLGVTLDIGLVVAAAALGLASFARAPSERGARGSAAGMHAPGGVA